MRRANSSGASDREPVKLDQVAEVLRENQKLITLGRIAASIAHEINNPLESITNLLYLMEQDVSAKNGEYLKLAQRELSRVVQISKQTLTFSRETRAPLRVQIAELIEEVLGLHARRIGDKSLRVVRQYETYESITVFPGEMRQVLSNLISNAIEATPNRGRIVIRIRHAHQWSGQATRGLRLSIGDNGAGIPAETRAHLGEPFFTTKGQSGTGLGLWVTRSILGRYGGSLRVRSSVGPERHGSVFTVFLPLNMRPMELFSDEEEADTPRATGTSGSRWRGLRLIANENGSSARKGSDRNSSDSEKSEDSSEALPESRRLRVTG